MRLLEFHNVIIDSTSQAVSTSQSTLKTTSSQTSSSGEFEEQLSTALAESLQKLGVGSGEVNITIKNPTPTTRQILVTYSVDGSPVTAPAVIRVNHGAGGKLWKSVLHLYGICRAGGDS